MGSVNSTVMSVASQCCSVGALDQGQLQRTDMLRKGAKFTRSLMLGMIQQELWVRLAEEDAAVVWRTMNSSNTDHGTIAIRDIHKAKANGETGLQLTGESNKALLDITAEDAATRDKWVVALSELLERTNATSADHMNRQPLSTPAPSDRGYWRDRQKEVDANKKIAEEKKKKYATAGMKYTAEAMIQQGK